MKTTTLLLLATAAAVPATAQDQDTKTARSADTGHERIETLLGAQVNLASPREGEDATAELSELLVAADGTIRWGLVESDGRTVLVPVDELTWNGENDTFSIARTAAELRAEREFDLGTAREKGLANTIAMWTETDPKPREAASSRTATFHGTELLVASDAILCGAELDELEVHGADGELGGVTQTFVDPKAMHVDLIVLSSGGLAGIGATDYLVPYEALTLCHAQVEEGEDPQQAERMLCVWMKKAQLEKAPEYREPETEGRLVDPANCDEAKRFYEARRSQN